MRILLHRFWSLFISGIMKNIGWLSKALVSGGMLIWLTALLIGALPGIAESKGFGSDTPAKLSDTPPRHSDTAKVIYKGGNVIRTTKSRLVVKGTVKPRGAKVAVYYSVGKRNGLYVLAKGSSKKWKIVLKKLKTGRTKLYVLTASPTGEISEPLLIRIEKENP